MKTKKQVIAYLDLFNIASEKDELAIESYLSRRSVVLDLDKTIEKPVNESLSNLTFEQFTDWYAKDFPKKNDVIVITESGLIGISQCFCFHHIVFGVSISRDGKLNTAQVNVPYTNYREASEEEKICLQKAINHKGMLWNHAMSKLVEASAPVDNQLLRVSLLGSKFCIGVFREISAEGKIVMYCALENNKPVRYSLFEQVADRDACQLEPVCVSERTSLANELEKAGKVWNGFARRIEPVNFRAEKGSVYHYIDDFLCIVTTIERNAPKDLKRLRSGNYFLNRSDAEEILASFNNFRKQQLINFIPNKDKKKSSVKRRSKE